MFRKQILCLKSLQEHVKNIRYNYHWSGSLTLRSTLTQKKVSIRVKAKPLFPGTESGDLHLSHKNFTNVKCCIAAQSRSSMLQNPLELYYLCKELKELWQSKEYNTGAKTLELEGNNFFILFIFLTKSVNSDDEA